MPFVAKFFAYDTGTLSWVYVVYHCASRNPRRRVMAYLPALSRDAAVQFCTSSSSDAQRLGDLILQQAHFRHPQTFWCTELAGTLPAELERLHLTNFHRYKQVFLAEVEADSATWDAQQRVEAEQRQKSEAAREQERQAYERWLQEAETWRRKQEDQRREAAEADKQRREQEDRQRQDEKRRQQLNRQRKQEKAQRWHLHKTEQQEKDAEQKQLGLRSTQKRLKRQQQQEQPQTEQPQGQQVQQPAGRPGLRKKAFEPPPCASVPPSHATPSLGLAGTLALVLHPWLLVLVSVCAVVIGCPGYVLGYDACGTACFLVPLGAAGIYFIQQAGYALVDWASRKRRSTHQPAQKQQPPARGAASAQEPARQQHASRPAQASQASPLRSRGRKHQRPAGAGAQASTQREEQRHAPAAQPGSQQRPEPVAEPQQQQRPPQHQLQAAADSQQGRAGQSSRAQQHLPAGMQPAAAVVQSEKQPQPSQRAMPRDAAPEPLFVAEPSQHAVGNFAEGWQLQEQLQHGTGAGGDSFPGSSSSHALIDAGSDMPAATYAATELTFFPASRPLQAGAIDGGLPGSSAAGVLPAPAAAAACVSSYDLDDDECIMCMEEPRSVVLYPCMHQVLCRTCTQKLMQRGSFTCPLCREEVMNVL